VAPHRRANPAQGDEKKKRPCGASRGRVHNPIIQVKCCPLLIKEESNKTPTLTEINEQQSSCGSLVQDEPKRHQSQTSTCPDCETRNETFGLLVCGRYDMQSETANAVGGRISWRGEGCVIRPALLGVISCLRSPGRPALVIVNLAEMLAEVRY